MEKMGLRRFTAEAFMNLVFTRLGMPKLSGWDVEGTIKENQIRKPPVAMITGCEGVEYG